MNAPPRRGPWEVQEDTNSHYFATGRLFLWLLSRNGISEKEKRNLIDATELAFLEQDFNNFGEYFSKSGHKNRKSIGKKVIFYASAFVASAFLIFKGTSYKKEIECLEEPEKKFCTVKKQDKKQDKKQNKKQNENKKKTIHSEETPDEVWGDIAETCLFVLNDPDLCLKYLEKAPENKKTDDLKKLSMDIKGEERLTDKVFRDIMERRSRELLKKDIPLDGMFEICLRRDTKESLETVKIIGNRLLEKKDSETEQMEKEKIKRYMAEATR